MNKRTIALFIALTVLMYAWPLWQRLHTSGPASRGFADKNLPVAFQSGEPYFVEEFITPPADIQVHAASIAELKDGTLVAAWNGGKHEGSADIRIYFTTRAVGKHWSPRSGIVSRESASRELNRYIKTLGNPLLFTDLTDRLTLIFVTVSLGRWSGSSLNMKTSTDRGRTWSRSQRLTLNPFFNLGELVRNNALRLANGGFAVPIHHEFAGIFSELLWLHPGGLAQAPEYFKTRLTRGKKYLQPAIVEFSPSDALAFHRSSRPNGRIAMSLSHDGGTTWTAPWPLDLPNPGSGLNAMLLSDGRVLLAFNDSLSRRDKLALAVSSRAAAEATGIDFRRWRRVAILEYTPGKDFSYPFMLRTADGKIHMVYTWNRERIKHVVFNEKWIERRLSSGSGHLAPVKE